MPLYKIKDFDPNYQDHFDGQDVKQLDLYSDRERVGSVDDVLVDNNGRFRYLVINTGNWFFGKKVLLPIGLAKIDYNNRRVFANGLTREQVENLPEFKSDMVADYDYEEQVRGVYRPIARTRSQSVKRSSTANKPIDNRAPLDTATPLEGSTYNTAYPAPTDAGVYDQEHISNYDRDSYRYDQEPALYNMTDRDHGQLKLYEERLIANKHREKTGEVVVGKHVETEAARVSVPIEKERVVIERNPVSAESPMMAEDADFREGEVARMEVYEEVPEISKEAFVREEVNVRKEVDRDQFETEDQIRREELNIDTQGRPVVDNRGDRV